MLLLYRILVIGNPAVLLMSISGQCKQERQNIRSKQQDLSGRSQNYLKGAEDGQYTHGCTN